MELVSQLIVEPVVKALTGYTTQKLRNFTSSADRVKEMIEKMEVLDSQRVDNEKHLRRNRENHLEIPDRVRGWLNEAKKIKEDVENDGCFVLEKKMRRNSENNQEIPDCVPESLEEVEKIKEDADNIPTNNDGCFNIKKKYRAGRNALRYIKVINRLIRESSEMNWSDAPIGFGRVDSKRLASTSGGGTHNLFKSRDKPFNDALNLLQQNDDDAARVIALCGMGGVGKTTLMNQLKEVAKNEKMFNCIVKAVIGNTPNLLDIQKVIAADTGAPLTETNVKLMATCLSKRFEEFSKSKEKILVILDDVWKESKIKLEDIGLASPLPNGFKLLLTSRDAHICRQIAVDADSAIEEVKVDFLKEGEAQDFFFRIAGNSARHDRDLSEIGCKIVKKCGYLPLAIKIIAATLKCEENTSVWRRTLDRLKRNDLEEKVQEIIEISYDSLEREDKAIFLLCGLFPEDSNIPIEDLTRYAWGLKLLKQVSTMGNARDSTQTSVSNLKNKYLLMDGDSRHSDCVKMHDLVLAFAVATVSKGGEDGCWIIHHEDFSKWSEADNMSQSCKQLSLTCKGMSEFPSEFQFPNLLLLKLMHGNESRFPQDFYVGMEKLQVIAFKKLKYPTVPTSFQCANLRTLCLHECSLMFDLTCIGNLSNLEVLSFANSSVTILPSTFGNLQKLRLLDVTGCCNLVIDDGVLKGLVKLEELYMIPYYEKACCFTDNNSKEFAERSENLKRFKLSVRCSFTEVSDQLETNLFDMHSYENSLKLVTNKEELRKYKMNELFKITNALFLQVNDMNSLEDAEIPHPPQNSSFYNLRLLVVSQCSELKYLFTPSVVTKLSKLEYLDISECPILEAVVHTENDGSVIIKFSNLREVKLQWLRSLKYIWKSKQGTVLKFPNLTRLSIDVCDSLEYVFTYSMVGSLLQLQELHISNCRSMKVIVKGEEESDAIVNAIVEFPCLKSLKLGFLDSLKYIWKSMQGTVLKFPNLTRLSIEWCSSLEYVFTCPMVGSLLQLQELHISWCDMKVIVKGEEEECDAIVNAIVVFPRLKSLKLKYLWNLEGFYLGKEDFEFPSLDTLQIYDCPKMTVFTKGDLSTPKLHAISAISIEGTKHNIHNRPQNSFLTS